VDHPSSSVPGPRRGCTPRLSKISRMRSHETPASAAALASEMSSVR
jgi:hypothetical protein